MSKVGLEKELLDITPGSVYSLNFNPSFIGQTMITS